MSIDWSIDLHERVGSTQDHVKAFAAEGALEGKVVQGLIQTGGYGRQGRGWVSEPGNLYMSVLLRPFCSVQEVTQLSFVASLAVAAAAEKYVGHAASLILKWPNDVLLDGKKCAGILLETEVSGTGRVDWLALGIGVNVANPPSELGSAIRDYVPGGQVELSAFRNALLGALSEFYSLWKSGEFAAIRREWLAKTYQKGAEVSYKIAGVQHSGYFDGIDPSGNLIVRDTDSVLKTISAGEVHFSAAP